MLAAIPYTTFPEIELGPLTLRTFGVAFAIGVAIGCSLAARWGERSAGIPRDDVISLATRMVVAGVIGSRLTWVATHLDTIEDPIDVIAIWEGGLQYAGGFLAALLVGYPTYRHWNRLTQGRMLDSAVFGLTVGIIFGRVGCYSVGEHLGAESTSFFLATRFDGGVTREGPPLVGQVIHNTALYEGIHLIGLAVLLWLVLRRRMTPITGAGIFALWYSAGRFTTDFLRSYDDLTWGMTGTQIMCIFLFPLGLYILLKVRPRMADRVEEEAVSKEEREADEPAVESGAMTTDSTAGTEPIR